MSTLALDIPAAALAAVCRRHRVRRLSLFGSVARGEARPDSDVDLLVEFEPGQTPGYFTYGAIAEELGGLVAPGRYVDLVTVEALHPRIAEYVLPTLVPLYHEDAG